MKPGPRNIRVQPPPLSPEEQEKLRLQQEESIRKLNREMAERQKQREKIHDILTQLQIPHDAGTNAVNGETLANILMDETKVKAILTRVRNKVFW